MRPDKSITLLQGLGYSVIGLPRADFKPCQTLLRTNKKQLTRLGDLSTIMTAGAMSIPPVSTDNAAPSGISGQQSSSVKVEIGVTILANMLQALTGTDLDISAGVKNSKSLTFA